MLLKFYLYFCIALSNLLIAENSNTEESAVQDGDSNASYDVEGQVKSLMQNIIDEYLNVLQSQSLSSDDKKNTFKECFIKYFTPRKIAGFVLGRYVREIKEENKEYFLQYLIDRITNMYVDQFAQFPNISVAIQSVELENVNDKSLYHVRIKIVLGDGQEDVLCVWTFIVDDDRDLKVSDVAISGISLKTTLRDVIQSEIVRGANDADVTSTGEDWVMELSDVDKFVLKHCK